MEGRGRPGLPPPGSGAAHPLLLPSKAPPSPPPPQLCSSLLEPMQGEARGMGEPWPCCEGN